MPIIKEKMPPSINLFPCFIVVIICPFLYVSYKMDTKNLPFSCKFSDSFESRLAMSAGWNHFVRFIGQPRRFPKDDVAGIHSVGCGLTGERVERILSESERNDGISSKGMSTLP